MECKYCGGIVRFLAPPGMTNSDTQCDNCGRYNCEKTEEDE